jgi:hypothetical protein
VEVRQDGIAGGRAYDLPAIVDAAGLGEQDAGGVERREVTLAQQKSVQRCRGVVGILAILPDDLAAAPTTPVEGSAPNFPAGYFASLLGISTISGRRFSVVDGPAACRADVRGRGKEHIAAAGFQSWSRSSSMLQYS